MHKLVMGSLVLIFVTLAWGTSVVGQEVRAPRGELRVVDKHPNNCASITVNVFEHLMELEKDGTLVPHLATGWRWVDDRILAAKLRQGVIFHNGEGFDHTLSQKDAVELVKTEEGHVDLVTELSALDTLRVAQSGFATVVKNRDSLMTVVGMFNMPKAGSPWHVPGYGRR